MAASVSIATPLGALSVLVHVDGTASLDPTRQSTLPTGARVLVWPDVGGLVIDALVSRLAPFPAASLDLPETQVWGVEWRFHAIKETADLTVSALLPDGVVSGSIGSDENLLTAEFVTADWVLAIGGPDEDSLARLAEEGREPASWNDLRMPSEDAAGGNGLIWHLPASAAATPPVCMSPLPGAALGTLVAKTRHGWRSTLLPRLFGRPLA